MDNSFTNLYLKVREKERRIYSDEEVSRLPHVARTNIHYPEWKVRERSARHLLNYLEKKKRPLTILEVGCGNGWLSAYLSKNPSWKVTGIDINELELSQAKRVFKDHPHLDFLPASLPGLTAKYDIIVFSASIQYFPDLKGIIGQALDRLGQNGEIHIMDSYFYTEQEQPAAKERTQRYYRELGFPEMADYYFHHLKKDLDQFNHHYPGRFSFLKRLISPGSRPFSWVCIKATKPLK